MLRTEIRNEKRSQAELDFDVYLFFYFCDPEFIYHFIESHSRSALLCVWKNSKKQSLLMIN